MKTIGVLTSGGDAPGMNAAIRAVVRCGLHRGCDVFGVKWGYSGLVFDDMQSMGLREVGGIIQQGGTILGSARCAEFRTEEGRQRALENLAKRGIEGLIVIGGNGTQTGAYELNKAGFPVVGVASTIDNDLVGSDITIGVDTALNIALEACDRLKVTASSHRRAFIVEVMGRDCGYLALMTAIAAGAEAVVIPEAEKTPEEIAELLRRAYARGKTNGLIVVAEGAKNNAESLAAWFKEHDPDIFELRVTTLGHVQRGGAPGAYDRLLATRLAATAVEYLFDGKYGMLIGTLKGVITGTPHSEIVGKHKTPDLRLLDLADVLSQ
ncbi:MAG: ATP-dependent 6-phosphofructokinase [Chloroflexota bacterium]|nr:ATP-dependent 6-phosphofructokinase [Chloroflexota bacterium]